MPIFGAESSEKHHFFCAINSQNPLWVWRTTKSVVTHLVFKGIYNRVCFIHIGTQVVTHLVFKGIYNTLLSNIFINLVVTHLVFKGIYNRGNYHLPGLFVVTHLVFKGIYNYDKPYQNSL